ncbi:MAG: malonyl-ACP O-methyltransferase BioC [Gammaproteobacteria bacterium]|nr:malonyl-ACP O-methyltransferase BioC [Gammaproteobacteria bacterium]
MSDLLNERLFELDRAQIKRAFNRAARGYDKAAILQGEVRTRLLERLELVTGKLDRVLDLGCGTGHSSAYLAKQFRKATVIALDIAEEMLRQTRRNQPWYRKINTVCGDVQRLPISDNAVDLVFCNLVIQWCNDIDGVFSEFRRVLRPNGLMIFSTFGPDTLKELRAAWAKVDQYSHVNHFVDMHDIGDALVRARMQEPVMQTEHFTLTYSSAFDLMRDLKAIGAHNVTRGRSHGLTGKQRLRSFEKEYEQYRRDGKLTATYEVVYGTAWAPDEQTGAVISQQGRVGVEELRRSLRGNREKS